MAYVISTNNVIRSKFVIRLQGTHEKILSGNKTYGNKAKKFLYLCTWATSNFKGCGNYKLQHQSKVRTYSMQERTCALVWAYLTSNSFFTHVYTVFADLQWEVGVFLLLSDLQAGQVGEVQL